MMKKDHHTYGLVSADVVIVCAEPFKTLDEVDCTGVDSGGVAGLKWSSGYGGGKEESNAAESALHDVN